MGCEWIAALQRVSVNHSKDPPLKSGVCVPQSYRRYLTHQCFVSLATVSGDAALSLHRGPPLSQVVRYRQGVLGPPFIRVVAELSMLSDQC